MSSPASLSLGRSNARGAPEWWLEWAWILGLVPAAALWFQSARVLEMVYLPVHMVLIFVAGSLGCAALERGRRGIAVGCFLAGWVLSGVLSAGLWVADRFGEDSERAAAVHWTGWTVLALWGVVLAGAVRALAVRGDAEWFFWRHGRV